MAKAKGLVKFTGTIDDLNFYYLNGKLVVRKAGGGFNRQAIKKSPRMELVRRNNSEFALCARANSEIRSAINPLKGNHKLTFLHSRLQGLLLKARKLDQNNPMGQRNGMVGLCTPNGLRMLRDFEVNPELPLRSALDAAVHFDPAAQQVRVEGLRTDDILYPKAATHVRFRVILLQVRAEEEDYKRFASEMITVARGQEPGELLLHIPYTADDEATTIVFLGMRFLQQIDDKLYNLNSKKALAVGVVL